MLSKPSNDEEVRFFNEQPWGRWIFFCLLAAGLFWGGLAIRLKYVDQGIASSYARSIGILSMFLGIVLFGTLLVLFVLNYLKK